MNDLEWIWDLRNKLVWGCFTLEKLVSQFSYSFSVIRLNWNVLSLINSKYFKCSTYKYIRRVSNVLECQHLVQSMLYFQQASPYLGHPYTNMWSSSLSIKEINLTWKKTNFSNVEKRFQVIHVNQHVHFLVKSRNRTSCKNIRLLLPTMHNIEQHTKIPSYHLFQSFALLSPVYQKKNNTERYKFIRKLKFRNKLSMSWDGPIYFVEYMYLDCVRLSLIFFHQFICALFLFFSWNGTTFFLYVCSSLTCGQNSCKSGRKGIGWNLL